MGFLVSHSQLRAIPPPPSLSVSPWRAREVEDTCAKPHENKAKWERRPLCDTIFAIDVAIYRMGNWPGAKIPEIGQENGKWPQARNGQEMAIKMEKWTRKRDFGLILAFFHFGGHFSAISGLGPFSIFFPIFPGFLLWASFPFCKWPLQSQNYLEKGLPDTGRYVALGR